MGLRGRIFYEIAANRDRRPISRAAALASKFLDAYENRNFTPATNGEQRVIEELPPVRVAFDVGANEGHWAAMMLTAHPGATVHCFEIVPDTAERLAARFAGDQRVVVNGCGLAAMSGERTVYVDPVRTDVNTIVARADRSGLAEIVAPVLTGDEYLAAHAIEHVDFLKIDTEGADLEVLRGFRDALERGQLERIQFEYTSLNKYSRTLLADFYELLGDQYEIGKIRPRRVEFKSYEPADENYKAPNCLAVRRS